MSDILNIDFRKQQPAPTFAPEIKFKEEQYGQLSNGLQIIVVTNNKLPRISAQLFIDHGLTSQGEKAGMVELTGQLLSCGTKNYTKAQWDNKVDYYGAHVMTSAIGGYAASLTKHFEAVFHLFSDAILRPSFPQHEFDNLIKQHLSNLSAQKEEADAIAGNISKRITFTSGHPYSETFTEKSLSKITLQDCVEYYEQNFVPEVSYLIFEGDIELAEAQSLAESYFGQWENRKFVKKQFDNVIPSDQHDVNFAEKSDAVQSLIAITYAVDYKPYNEDMLAANLMNSVLGGYFSSRLNLNLREKKGFTYGISSRLHNDEFIGTFSTSVNVRNEVTLEAITEILSEITRLKSELMSEEELQQVKNVISGNFSRSVEDPKTIAKFALAKKKFGLPDDYFKTQLRRIAALTTDVIHKMANKYLQPENLHIIVVGNKEVLPQLESLAGSKGVRLFDFEGNLIE